MNEDIKKELYRLKPVAKRMQTTNKHYVYYVKLPLSGDVYFEIPIEEAVGFGNKEQAQLLIRWLI